MAVYHFTGVILTGDDKSTNPTLSGPSAHLRIGPIFLEEGEGRDCNTPHPGIIYWQRVVAQIVTITISQYLDAWITGVRREQSATRAKTQTPEIYEFDRLRGKQIVKVNPLVTWSSQDVWDYIHRYGIPYNPLKDRGFRSIGCYPCTRAVISG